MVITYNKGNKDERKIYEPDIEKYLNFNEYMKIISFGDRTRFKDRELNV